MYTWKLHGEKWVTLWGGLELRNKCPLNKEKGSCRLLRGEKMVLGKQKGPSEDSMGSLTVWDRVCLDAMLTFSLISCDKNPSSLLKTLPGGNWWWPSSFWRIWLKADEGDQSLSCICCFPVPSAQSNQCTKAAYVRVAWPGVIQSHFWDRIFCFPLLWDDILENSKLWR